MKNRNTARLRSGRTLPSPEPQVQPQVQMANQQNEEAKRFQPLSFATYHEKPATYFRILDADFRYHKITNQEEMWLITVRTISKNEQVALKVMDLFDADPTENGAYDKLKKEVIERLEKSSEEKLEQLIAATDRGDRPPSQYLRELRTLAPSGPISDGLVKRAVLHSLPPSIRLIYESISSSKTAEEIAKNADSVLAKMPHIVDAVDKTPEKEDILAAISKLSNDVEELKNASKNYGRPQFRPKHNYSKKVPFKPHWKQTHDANGICFYHQKYQSKAKKCVSPCAFTNSKQKGN